MIKLKGSWDGWTCDNQYLVDNAGNKYLPGHLVETFYGRMLYRELTGRQTNIRTMKGYLKNRVRTEKSKSMDIHTKV